MSPSKKQRTRKRKGGEGIERRTLPFQNLTATKEATLVLRGKNKEFALKIQTLISKILDLEDWMAKCLACGMCDSSPQEEAYYKNPATRNEDGRMNQWRMESDRGKELLVNATQAFRNKESSVIQTLSKDIDDYITLVDKHHILNIKTLMTTTCADHGIDSFTKTPEKPSSFFNFLRR